MWQRRPRSSNSHHNRRAALLEASQAFCSAFASQKPVPEILSQHFSSKKADDIVVIEHGLSQLAPFLGHPFTGTDGARTYFSTVANCLQYRDMSFDNYVVDAEADKVSVRGEAVFTWTSTAQSWREVLTYVLAFDDDQKVVTYEIWADSGAAYLASRGELLDQQAEKCD